MNSLDFEKPVAATRVVVAMSGGVDSSVVAALLRDEGYDVVGVTLRLYDDRDTSGRKGTCCAGRDIGDARAVAARLGIPHFVLDYEARFREAVIDPFIASYARGETPIPCATCNNSVKFTDLLETARDLGADALATGHYCVTRAIGGGRRALYRGADAARDQSYFLYGTTAAQLAMIRFPLGDLPKARVREIARDRDLVNANKPDSQDICFVPRGRYSDIIAKLSPEAMQEGDILDQTGKILGRHRGIAHYTVGQRKGLDLGGRINPGGDSPVLHVTRIDAASRQVVVGPSGSLRTRQLALRAVNWLGDAPLDVLPADGLDVFVRTRSTRPPVPARLRIARDQTRPEETAGAMALVDFAEAESAVSPGQACVFYASDAAGARVLGGGTVMRPSTALAADDAAMAS